MTNETQEIDADALRARLAETPADLRGRIEAALRARHGADASVHLGPAPDEFSGRDAVAFVMGGYVAIRADDDGAALRGLARFVGLNADGSDPRDQGEALARRLHAEREAVVAELDRTRDEVDALESLVARQADILTGVANALRGEPAPLASHSHHDLAERAAAMVALLAVTQSSLEAASSGRRVTACDEIERLQRENATLRDAAREHLDARAAYDAADTYEATNADDERRAWERRAAAHDALRALVGGAS